MASICEAESPPRLVSSHTRFVDVLLNSPKPRGASSPLAGAARISMPPNRKVRDPARLNAAPAPESVAVGYREKVGRGDGPCAAQPGYAKRVLKPRSRIGLRREEGRHLCRSLLLVEAGGIEPVATT